MAFVAILYLHKTHNALRLGGSLSSFAAILVWLVSESLSDMGKNDFCCAHGCANNRRTNPNLQFYRIPKDLSRRKAWLSRIRRENFTPTDNTRICSEHFVGGTKSDDPEAEGYVPSIFSHSHSVSNTPRTSRNSLKSDTAEIIVPKSKPKRRKLAQVSKTVKCRSDYSDYLLTV